MPESSVDEAVEKMIGEAPAQEKPQSEAPAQDTTETTVQEPSAKPDQEPSDEPTAAGGLTPFERELIGQLSEEERQAFESSTPEVQKESLKFAKRVYRDNAKQMTELGQLRKARSVLQDSGITNEDLVALIQQKRNGTPPKTASELQAASARGFKRLLAKAQEPGDREALQESESVIRELIEDVLTEHLGKEVKPIKDRLEAAERQRISERIQTLDQDINALEDEFGYPGSLVETHRESMRRLGLQHPDLDAEELLIRAAGFKTVKQAMANVTQTETPKGTRRSAPVVKAEGQQVDMPRDKRGVISITKAIDRLVRHP